MSNFQEIELAPVPVPRVDTDSYSKHKIDTPLAADALSAQPTLAKSDSTAQPVVLNKRRENIYGVAACIALFIAGWQDGSAGPLIPSLQRLFDVNYTIISMIFVCGFVGFAGAGFLNMYLTDRLGLGRVFALGALIQVAGYALQFWHPPFALFSISFFVIGFGVSAQDAQANSLVNRFSSPEMKMQFLHAAYGIGATVAPLAATLFVINVPKFYHYYLLSFSLAIVNLVILVLVFRMRTATQLLGADDTWKGAPDKVKAGKRREGAVEEGSTGLEMPATPAPETVISTPGVDAVAGFAELERGLEVEPTAPESTGTKMKAMLSDRRVYLLAGFLLLYVGMEVTIGGWIVSFVIEHRNGPASSGYISTGFFGGLTLGRLVLIPVNKRLGDIVAIYTYLFICLGFEFVVWFAPNIVANAIAVCIIGLFLGPIYPLCMNWIGKSFPPSMVSGVIGMVASVGAAGSCLFPFMTGALANRYGVQVMQPVILAMIAACLIMWFFLPKRGDRKKE